jgi:hypothetical protein
VTNDDQPRRGRPPHAPSEASALNKYYATLYSDARNDELTEIGESIFQRAKVSDTLVSLVAKTRLGWSEKNKLEVKTRNRSKARLAICLRGSGIPARPLA